MCPPIVNVDVLKNIFGADIVSGGEGKLIRQKCNQNVLMSTTNELK